MYSAIGYYPVFLMRQNAIRKEIKQKIKNAVPENEMFVFSLSEEEYSGLNWKRENKEFQHGNTMYDVVRKSPGENGNITLYCINDTQESQLFGHLDEQVQKNSSAGNHVQKLFKLLSNISFSETINIIFFTEKKGISYSEIKSSIHSFTGKIPSPPPELV